MTSNIVCFLSSMVFIIGISIIIYGRGKKLFGTNEEGIGKLIIVLTIIWAVTMSSVSFTYFILSNYL